MQATKTEYVYLEDCNRYRVGLNRWKNSICNNDGKKFLPGVNFAGGKLTGYRKMAERVLKQISKKINITISASKTDKLKISTSSFEICFNKVSTHFDKKISRRLFNRYGEDILMIHEIYMDLLKKYKSKFLLFSELRD